MGEWYYIGHYGQLGPLTKEQIDELIEGGVIAPDTYVWRSGMLQWQLAETVGELKGAFESAAPFSAPPPPPLFTEQQQARPPQPQYPTLHAPPAVHSSYVGVSYYQDVSLAPRSDRSRVLGGVLQLLLPGVGRMYLGYYAYGTLQLILAICTGGVLWLWSFIDGIIILGGGLKFDGFGRVLGD